MSRAVKFGFKFPASKALLDKEVRASQLLSSLWFKSDLLTPDTLNCPLSLPLDIKTKAEIYTEVAAANPDKSGFGLKFKQTVGYGKTLVTFYKKGLTNVWSNYFAIRRLKSSEFKLHQLDNKGLDVNVKIPGFGKLTEEMSLVLYTSSVENKSANEYVVGEVKKTDKVPTTVDEALFNLTRTQYQLLKRTPMDFLKLPTFAVIFMIFMECTPFLCYAIPEITPLTCVLPSILPRMWPHRTPKTYKEEELEEVAVKNAYNLDIAEVRLLCRGLRLITKYVPVALVPESVLRARLQHYYQYLKVDNYYLSGLNGGGNVWNLSDQELLQAALERNLIPNLKEVVTAHEKITEETERKRTEKEYMDILRLRLFHFIVDFDNANLGYLLVAPQLHDPVKSQLVYGWWKQDHST